METVELARQRAAQLHADLVAKGRDPWKPYEFAAAEAKRRGFDVEATAPGAALLDGGRATAIIKDDLILHEDAGTLFEKAFLVAHEIGHLELGDDPDAVDGHDIDPLRPAEASPVGLDRVVDYGRRQRREVQMDLFARELLLPRSVARRLHLVDKLTATAIAERLGAPFEVVAQQLLDALLLPPVEIVPIEGEGRPEHPLNPLQAEAARHRGAAYLLEAGPGTGKTQTLAARVEGLLDDGVDPRRILVLTFSNKAAGEMAARIARRRADAAAAMWIGTFHAFGLDIIRRFHAELGLAKDPRLMDRTEAVELLEYEFPRLGLVHHQNLYDPTQIIADMLAAISRAKDEVVDANRYGELAAGMARSTAEEREAAERAVEVASVYAKYEELKRSAGCVDFGDLVSLPVTLLEGNDAIRAHVSGLYDHVLVDEYQDVNRSSVRLIAALRPNGRDLWAVGDAKQSIYRFRGASSFNMRRFGVGDFAGGQRGRLRRNYRSVDEVVAAYSAFAVEMRVREGPGDLEADRGASGSTPELRTVGSAEEQPVALADAIDEMRRHGYSYRDQAVLCTGNEKLSTLALQLERLGIPVLFLGSLFERPEIKDLLSLLSVLTDRRAMGLVRLACWPEFQMSLTDVAAIFDHLRSLDASPASWLRKPDDIPGVTAGGRAMVSRLGEALNGFDQAASPWTVLATVLFDRTRLAASLAESSSIADQSRGMAIWQFMNFIRVQPASKGLPIVRLLDRVRRLVRLGDERDLRQLPTAAQSIDAVRLMTIHGAKGLEFPVVHVPGLNGDTIPRTPPAPPCPPPDGMIEGGTGTALKLFREGQAEEQECLFYVALSRARDRLFLYAPMRKTNGHNRPLSSFLDRLGSGLRRQNVVPARLLPPAPEAGEVPLHVTGPLRFGSSQVALYESCPRRFFYTHILQIGGRRTSTAFMRMHEAVRTVYQAIISGTLELASEGDLERRVDEALAENGLSDHGYVADYRGFAVTMIRYFLGIRAGHRPEAPTALKLNFGGEEVVVLPDDVLLRPDGTRIVRRVQTGHQRSAESKDVGAAAFILAAQQAFPGATVELVHLSDGTATPLNLTATELRNRRDKLAGYLADIRGGRFPAVVSAFTCPKCPAFFVCGQVPAGELPRIF